MARALDLVWPGGEHPFRLGISGIEAIQEKCDAGPNLVFARLKTGAWKTDDVRHVLRQGLIGGGMDPPKATRLVEDLLERANKHQLVVTAGEVLTAWLLGGTDDDPVGEPSLAGETTHPSETDAGDSAPFTP